MLINPTQNIGNLSLRLAHAGILLVLLQLSSSAFAREDEDINPDRPGIADGSKVIDSGRSQIETGLQKEYRDSGPSVDHRFFLPTLLRVGIDKRWEVRVESNTYSSQRISDPETGNSHKQGIAPISLGAKYQFPGSDDGAQPSVGAIVRVFPASGSRDFRSQHSTGDIRLAADWDFAEKWSLNPNVGVAVYEDDQSRLFNTGLLAVTLSYVPSKALNFFVDTGIQSREQKHGKPVVICDAGVAYLPRRDIQLDFSVGEGVKGETPPHFFVSLGISKMF